MKNMLSPSPCGCCLRPSPSRCGSPLTTSLSVQFFLHRNLPLLLGIGFYSKKMKHARSIVQLAVALIMLIYLGILSRENMQLEVSGITLFLGCVRGGGHSLCDRAKFSAPSCSAGDGCGYACWTAMILDLLPYKVPRQPRKNRFYPIYRLRGFPCVRRCALYFSGYRNLENIMFWSFIAGNALYYIAGIGLAFCFSGQPRLQIHLPHHRVFETGKLFFPAGG